MACWAKLTHEYWVWGLGYCSVLKCESVARFKNQKISHKIPPSSFSWQGRQSASVECSALGTVPVGAGEVGDPPAGPISHLPPSLPAWPLQVLECVTSSRGHRERLGRDMLPQGGRHDRRRGLREERRNPGILKVGFVPFTELPPSVQRFLWAWRGSQRSPLTPWCSHSAKACAVMVEGREHWGKWGFSLRMDFTFFLIL